MVTLAFHIDHRVAPGADAGVANAVAEILARPCFGALTRVAVNAKDRDKKHQRKTVAAIVDTLVATESDAAVLDSGRSGDVIASARIWTGKHVASYDDPKPFLASYVVLPFEREHRAATIDSFVDLASALDAVAGYIAVENTHDRAHAAAISQPPPREQVRDYPRRAQERKAHFWHDKQIGDRVAGPDWGLVLGPAHLRQLSDLSAFPIVKAAGRGKLVLLSTDPDDALREDFDERLEATRRALGGVLMDVSGVPVG